MSPTEPWRAAIYARASVGNAIRYIAQQEHAAQRAINEQEWRHVGTYSDRGFGWPGEERDGLNRLLGRASAGDLDVVVVEGAARLSRNWTEAWEIVEYVLDVGVHIFFVKTFKGEELMRAEPEHRELAKAMFRVLGTGDLLAEPPDFWGLKK